jgi:Kef-type K+ transport system membrane component KefB
MTNMLKAALDKFALRIALVMIAILLAVFGVAFLLVSLHLWLSETWSLPAAAGLTGAIALLAAAVPLLVVRLMDRGSIDQTIHSSARPPESQPAEAAAMASALGAELGSWVADNSRTAVIGAFLTGALLGASPKARSELRKFIETFGTSRGSPS